MVNTRYEYEEQYEAAFEYTSGNSRVPVSQSAGRQPRQPGMKEPLTQGRYINPQNQARTEKRPTVPVAAKNTVDPAKKNSYPEIQGIARRVTRTRARFEPLAGIRSFQSGPAEADNPAPHSPSWYKNSFILLTMSFLAVLAVFSVSLLSQDRDESLSIHGSGINLSSNSVKYRYDTLPPGFDINSLPLGGLPPGSYTHSGTGSWRILPVPDDTSATVGPSDGTNYNYVVGIEQGIKDPSVLADPEAVAELVKSIYASPYGWTSPRAARKVKFTQIGPNQGKPSFQVLLTTPDTTKKLCGFEIPIESSCYLASNIPGQNMIVLNLARYLLGAKTFGGDTMSYREYEINHETGHAIGYGHQPCSGNGRLAPVMMEQTFSLTNSDIFKFDKSGAVPDNNLTCRPNPWPYPSHT